MSWTNSVASRASTLSGIGMPAMVDPMAFTRTACRRRSQRARGGAARLIGLRDHHLVHTSAAVRVAILLTPIA